MMMIMNITAAGAVDRELLHIELGNLLPPTATTAARATATTTQTPHSRAHPQDYGHRPNSFKLLLLLLLLLLLSLLLFRRLPNRARPRRPLWAAWVVRGAPDGDDSSWDSGEFYEMFGVLIRNELIGFLE